MDRVGLPTAVRSSARPRHRSVDGGAPHAVVKSLPQRNLDGYSAASSQARATCKKYRPLCRFSRPSPTETPHAFLPSAVPGSHRERLLKGIHAIDQNHFYSGQPWSISRLLADTHGPS